ncbi:UNVERIFIED_CONTAM: hypothetical protein HDU68_009480 [Siphonaria sp. JEL0065]|nr:hypothetical protein HDU68_009480 [Siphonaria sp. JEL0065]
MGGVGVVAVLFGVVVAWLLMRQRRQFALEDERKKQQLKQQIDPFGTLFATPPSASAFTATAVQLAPDATTPAADTSQITSAITAVTGTPITTNDSDSDNEQDLSYKQSTARVRFTNNSAATVVRQHSITSTSSKSVGHKASINSNNNKFGTLSSSTHRRSISDPKSIVTTLKGSSLRLSIDTRNSTASAAAASPKPTLSLASPSPASTSKTVSAAPPPLSPASQFNLKKPIHYPSQPTSPASGRSVNTALLHQLISIDSTSPNIHSASAQYQHPHLHHPLRPSSTEELEIYNQSESTVLPIYRLDEEDEEGFVSSVEDQAIFERLESTAQYVSLSIPNQQRKQEQPFYDPNHEFSNSLFSIPQSDSFLASIKQQQQQQQKSIPLAVTTISSNVGGGLGSRISLPGSIPSTASTESLGGYLIRPNGGLTGQDVDASIGPGSSITSFSPLNTVVTAATTTSEITPTPARLQQSYWRGDSPLVEELILNA